MNPNSFLVDSNYILEVTKMELIKKLSFSHIPLYFKSKIGNIIFLLYTQNIYLNII